MGATDNLVAWRLGPLGSLAPHSAVTVEPAVAAGIFPAYRNIPTYDYFDVSTAYEILPELTVSAVMTNVFDKDPPNVGNTVGGTAFNGGNTFPTTYDATGRFISFGVNVKY